MALVYLDTCALQRPLDDRTQLRVRIDAEAVEAVLREVERGRVGLLSSDVLVAESSAAPDRTRRDFAAEVLARASRRVGLDAEVERRATVYRAAGMRSLDALHLASAVCAAADYFRSTDDRLLRRAGEADTHPTRVVTPTDLAFTLGL